VVHVSFYHVSLDGAAQVRQLYQGGNTIPANA
jgi:hypothetical protein